MSKVGFYLTTKAQYDAITNKSESALYFITDTCQIFRGSAPFSHPVKIVSTLPEPSACDCGSIYFNTTTSTINIYDGSKWNTIEASGVALTSVSDHVVTQSDKENEPDVFSNFDVGDEVIIFTNAKNDKFVVSGGGSSKIEGNYEVRVWKDGKIGLTQSAQQWTKIRGINYAGDQQGVVKLADNDDINSVLPSPKAITVSQLTSAINSASSRPIIVDRNSTDAVIESLQPGTDYIFSEKLNSLSISFISSFSDKTTVRFNAVSNIHIDLPATCDIDGDIDFSNDDDAYVIEISNNKAEIEKINTQIPNSNGGVHLFRGANELSASWKVCKNLSSGFSAVVRSGGLLEYPSVYNQGRIIVSDGGRVINPYFSGTGAAANSQLAWCYVSEGGIVSGGTAVNANYNVLDSGTVIDATFVAPTYMNLKSGCILSKCTIINESGINTGRYTLSSGASAFGTILSGKATLTIESGAITSDTVITGSAKVVYNNISTIYSPSAYKNSKGSGIVVSSGMTAFSPKIYAGGKIFTSLDTVVSDVVISGFPTTLSEGVGSAYFKGGVVNGLIASDYSEIVITSTIVNGVVLKDNAYLTTRSGAIVSNISAVGSDLIRVSNGSIVSNVIISSGCTCYIGASSYLNGLIVGKNGWFVAYNYCNGENITIESGASAWISAGGLLNNVTVMSGGTLTLDSAVWIAYTGNIDEIPSLKGGSALNVNSAEGATINVLSGVSGAGYIKFA